MRLLDLPRWLDTWGLPYVEVEGWQTRGAELADDPGVVIGHHTATPAAAKGDLPTLRILRDGRSDLPGPLCQLALSRSGVVHIIASGKANHAGRGAWRGITASNRTVGIEAEHPGRGAWPQVQLDAFDKLAACLLWGLGLSYTQYCQHKEWALPAGRKVDCNFDPSAQRGRIARLLTVGPVSRLRMPHDPPVSPMMKEDDVSFTFHSEGKAYLRDGGDTIHVPTIPDLVALHKVGVKDAGQLSPEMTARLLEAAKS